MANRIIAFLDFWEKTKKVLQNVLLALSIPAHVYLLYRLMKVEVIDKIDLSIGMLIVLCIGPIFFDASFEAPKFDFRRGTIYFNLTIFCIYTYVIIIYVI